MKTKAIVFTKPYTAELTDSECWPPSDNEVSVKLEYSAISAGTEKANFIGVVSEEGPASFPRTVGYSAVGRITAIGREVKDISVGDRVIVYWGRHRGMITINRKNVIKVPDEISSEEAAIAFISTFPIAAIRKTHLEIGESAMVMGLGILGIFAVQQLRIAGAYPIIAVDPKPERRALAMKMGADYALDPTSPEFVDEVKRVSEGGVNVCIEVTGIGQGLIQALDCMKRMGRVALLGCTRDPHFEINYYSKVHSPGISLIGAHTNARPATESSPGLWTDEDDLNAILKLLKGKRLNYRDLIHEIHSPLDAQKVYERLVNDKDFPIGVLFDWNKI